MPSRLGPLTLLLPLLLGGSAVADLRNQVTDRLADGKPVVESPSVASTVEMFSLGRAFDSDDRRTLLCN